MENIKNTLIGKTVMSVRGIRIGVITDSLVDDVSGEITSVFVKPSSEINTQNYKFNEHGDIVFPCTSLVSVKDVIIVEDPLL